MQNSRTWRYSYQFVLASFGMYAVGSHAEQLGKFVPWLHTTALEWTLSVVGIVVLLALSAIPTALVGLGIRRRKVVELRADKRLDEIFHSLRQDQHAKEVPHNTFQTRFLALEQDDCPVYIWTCVATFFIADRLSNKWGEKIEDNVASQGLQAAAAGAWAAQAHAEKVNAPIHLFVPDSRNRKVRAVVAARAATIDFPRGSTTDAHADTIRWFRELKTKRQSKGKRTNLYLLSHVPVERVLLTQDWCLFQSFPPNRPGLTEPLWLVERTSDTNRDFEALHAILDMISWSPPQTG